MKRYMILIWTLVLPGLLLAQKSVPSHKIYQVQLAAYKSEVDWSRFGDLKQVGFVSTQSIADKIHEDDYIRIFVGKFLGEATLNDAQSKLIKKGFTDISVESSLEEGDIDSKGLRYSIQLGAYNKLDVSEFADFQDLENLYILFEKGKYKLLYGLYEEQEDAREALLDVQDREKMDGIIRKLL